MKRHAGFAIAAAAALCLSGLAIARADQFSDQIDKAKATLTAIDQLIDSSKAHASTAAAEPTGRSQERSGQVAVAAKAETLKCAACGMEMPTKRANRNQRAVKIGGKTYYCCRGCDMSKIIDKK